MKKTAATLFSFFVACCLVSLLHAQTPPGTDAALLLSLKDGRAETVVVCHRTYLKVRDGGKLGSLKLLTPDPSKPAPPGAVDIEVGVRDKQSLWVQALIANQPTVSVISASEPVPPDIVALRTAIGRLDTSILQCVKGKCTKYCAGKCCEQSCTV